MPTQTTHLWLTVSNELWELSNACLKILHLQNGDTVQHPRAGTGFVVARLPSVSSMVPDRRGSKTTPFPRPARYVRKSGRVTKGPLKKLFKGAYSLAILNCPKIFFFLIWNHDMKKRKSPGKTFPFSI